jgi:hypothetical protein
VQALLHPLAMRGTYETDPLNTWLWWGLLKNMAFWSLVAAIITLVLMKTGVLRMKASYAVLMTGILVMLYALGTIVIFYD